MLHVRRHAASVNSSQARASGSPARIMAAARTASRHGAACGWRCWPLCTLCAALQPPCPAPPSPGNYDYLSTHRDHPSVNCTLGWAMAVIPDVSSPPQVAARGAIRNRNHDLEATIEAGGEFLWTLPDIEMTTGPFRYPPLGPRCSEPYCQTAALVQTDLHRTGDRPCHDVCIETSSRRPDNPSVGTPTIRRGHGETDGLAGPYRCLRNRIWEAVAGDWWRVHGVQSATSEFASPSGSPSSTPNYHGRLAPGRGIRVSSRTLPP
jgi:hypothetical protein